MQAVQGREDQATNSDWDEHAVLHQLAHHLPAQAPLKDFIHHNTLHAFQHRPFFQGLAEASAIFGYQTLLPLAEFRTRYAAGDISQRVLEHVIQTQFPGQVETWVDRMLHTAYPAPNPPRIGRLRAGWKQHYRLDLDARTHGTLFRLLNSYLDQGISIWRFPVMGRGLLSSIRQLEAHSRISLFRTQRVRHLLARKTSLVSLLDILVGDERLYTHYLYDQQFAHPGWSGMVATIEAQPQTLLDRRQIKLHDLIVLECLLEIDAMDAQFPKGWPPLAQRLSTRPTDLFAHVVPSELHTVLSLWQQALEWSYDDQVLAGLQQAPKPITRRLPSFQALFCIDDRECSLRRHIEVLDADAQTFGTPGFFGVDAFYQPEGGQFVEKICPAPVAPKHVIREVPLAGNLRKRRMDPHFNRSHHALHSGFLITQALGVWSALRLAFDIFRPSSRPAAASSFQHMHQAHGLTVAHDVLQVASNGLQVGYTVQEMAARVEGLLKSIGLVRDFAPLIYVMGHGSSSMNNPHYAAYDCGACSGRAGSVNARAISEMANRVDVRELLATRGIHIPDTTQFLGGLHDTTRDEVQFYDEAQLSSVNQALHNHKREMLNQALALNARERARRFMLVDSRKPLPKIHNAVKRRSISLFEPRPELNHATNALCIVGRRELTRHLFLDRRSFLNSYDASVDPDGAYLLNILKACAPVCGGINLEYYFSRVDNAKLGAGSKLPHNVMGLIGVANGNDGDLRPGLPSQMIEVHDPLRLLLIVEHDPDVVLDVIQRHPPTYEWFANGWVNLACVTPDERRVYVFQHGGFQPYTSLTGALAQVANLDELLTTQTANLPVLRVQA